jgi:hypothetical protein
MRTRTIKFDDDKIPAWTYDGGEPGAYTFASAIALAGLEDAMIRLSSALQTRLLGHNVFGKATLHVAQGRNLSCFPQGLHENETPRPLGPAASGAEESW